MLTKEQTELILQGISLILRAEFSCPERFEDIYYTKLCEDMTRWFESYDKIKTITVPV